jgi:hypothetical protein
MKPLIINIRGNSGSGKTFLTREFMKKCTPPESWDNTGEPDQSLMFEGQFWVVLGRYGNVCGGCDTIKTQAEIVRRIKFYTKEGAHIWVEGLILSTIYGTVGEFSERYGDRWVFAYLNTPIETCIERIKARRRAAGNEKPLNETNTRARVSTILRNREIVESHGRRTMTLSWRDPLPVILKLIRKEGA